MKKIVIRFEETINIQKAYKVIFELLYQLPSNIKKQFVDIDWEE